MLRLDKARGPSAAAREGDRGTKLEGGGGAEIEYLENPFAPLYIIFLPK